MKNFSPVPSLKFLCEKTIARHEISIGSTDKLPSELKEELAETKNICFTLTAFSSGREGMFNEETYKFVDFVKIICRGRLDIAYLIYNLRNKNDFAHQASSDFWSKDRTEIDNILSEIPPVNKYTDTELDWLIYTQFRQFGDIQVITKNGTDEKRYTLEPNGYFFATGVKRVLTHEDPLDLTRYERSQKRCCIS